MSRLAPRRREDLDEAGQAVWDVFVERRTDRVIGPDGALIGPWNAMIIAPHIGAWMQGLGPALRRISLDPRLIEIAILTTADGWRAEFEWFGHAEMAINAGVPRATVDSLVHGARATVPSEPEQVVHDVAHQLVTTGHVDGVTYETASRLFGDVGVIELVTICGFYAFVSFLLNTFEVSLPDGAEPVFGN